MEGDASTIGSSIKNPIKCEEIELYILQVFRPAIVIRNEPFPASHKANIRIKPTVTINPKILRNIYFLDIGTFGQKRIQMFDATWEIHSLQICAIIKHRIDKLVNIRKIDLFESIIITKRSTFNCSIHAISIQFRNTTHVKY